MRLLPLALGPFFFPTWVPPGQLPFFEATKLFNSLMQKLLSTAKPSKTYNLLQHKTKGQATCSLKKTKVTLQNNFS